MMDGFQRRQAERARKTARRRERSAERKERQRLERELRLATRLAQATKAPPPVERALTNVCEACEEPFRAASRLERECRPCRIGRLANDGNYEARQLGFTAL
jgi:hypothetical protein